HAAWRRWRFYAGLARRTAGNVRISSLRGKTAMLLNSTHTAHAGHPTLPEKLFSSMGEVAVPSVAKLPSRSRGGLPPRALRSVREFIEAHLEENISITSWPPTRGLPISPSAGELKHGGGVPPPPSRVRARGRGARAFRPPPALPLPETALAAGFADQSHCARRFREHVGVTPSSY